MAWYNSLVTIMEVHVDTFLKTKIVNDIKLKVNDINLSIYFILLEILIYSIINNRIEHFND